MPPKRKSPRKPKRLPLGETAALVRRTATVTRAGATTSEPTSPMSSAPQSLKRKRELVADLCRLLGERVAGVRPPAATDATSTDAAARPGAGAARGQTVPDPTFLLHPFSPRAKQTLELLLAGDSEKQIARKLSLSRHTIHVYVKALYRGLGVSSRGELLARFINGNARPAGAAAASAAATAGATHA